MSGAQQASKPVDLGASKIQHAMPSTEQIQAKFELGVAVALFDWSALTLAVQSGWGGPDSEGKREWFAGAIVEMFSERAQTDVEDVETTLLQVMFDEFEVNVDDETAYEVAETVMAVRRTTLQGDFALVEELNRKWLARKGKAAEGYQKVEAADDGDGDDDAMDSDSESGDLESDEDAEMQEAPALVKAKRENASAEVDEDGFTKVGKKRP